MTGTIAMDNPWLELPEVPDYILPQDRAQMDAHGESPQRLGLNLQLLPVPWNGALGSASVVLPTLNPSVRDNAVSEERDSDFRKAILANLQFGNDPPFFSLDKRFRKKGGYE